MSHDLTTAVGFKSGGRLWVHVGRRCRRCDVRQSYVQREHSDPPVAAVTLRARSTFCCSRAVSCCDSSCRVSCCDCSSASAACAASAELEAFLIFSRCSSFVAFSSTPGKAKPCRLLETSSNPRALPTLLCSGRGIFRLGLAWQVTLCAIFTILTEAFAPAYPYGCKVLSTIYFSPKKLMKWPIISVRN